MPFKTMHRIKKIASSGGRKKASLGKRVLKHVKKHKVAYGAGAGAYVVGRRGEAKRAKKREHFAYSFGRAVGRQERR